MPEESSTSPKSVPAQSIHATDSLEKNKDMLGTPQLPSKNGIAAFPSMMEDGPDKEEAPITTDETKAAANNPSTAALLASINQWIVPEFISAK